MIKVFSKWLELVPLLDCNNEYIAYAFMNIMFKRFGALVEVLIDHNIKICEEFQKFYENTLIDHYIIHETILRYMG